MCDLQKVTVLLAAHNRKELLKDSLDSALKQDFESFEVLVIDDGSNEETRAWLDEEATIQKRLRILHQEHCGVAVARQNGLKEARGEFVCILDSDDRLVPNALSHILTVFTERPETDLVYCNNLHLIGSEKIRAFKYPCYDNNDNMLRSTLLRPVVPFKHSGTTFRKDLALMLGGYDIRLPLKIDIDFFLKFLTNGRRLVLVNDPLVEFHMHKNSISAKRLLGIKVWWLLINRYGPRDQLQRIFYKSARTVSELLKLAYLLLRIK
jgi:glycosyltransferase involved in cell wall biosynthesis